MEIKTELNGNKHPLNSATILKDLLGIFISCKHRVIKNDFSLILHLQESLNYKVLSGEYHRQAMYSTSIF
jgi:hypothetical protein